MVQKAFSVGNSVVLTIPAKVGIKAGTPVRFVKKSNRKLIYEISDESTEKRSKDDDIEEYLAKVTGGFMIRDGVTPTEIAEIIKELEEHPYDKSIRIS